MGVGPRPHECVLPVAEQTSGPRLASFSVGSRGRGRSAQGRAEWSRSAGLPIGATLELETASLMEVAEHLVIAGLVRYSPSPRG